MNGEEVRRRPGTRELRNGRQWAQIIALLSLVGCDHEVSKAWDSGGKIEAKVSAQTCPPASAAPERPLVVQVSCGDLSKGFYSALADMHVLTEGKASRPEHREAWDLSCFQNDCRLLTLELDALAEQSRLWPASMGHKEGHMVRAGTTGEVRFDDGTRGMLKVDTSLGVWSYDEDLAGVRVRGTGRCSQGK